MTTEHHIPIVLNVKKINGVREMTSGVLTIPSDLMDSTNQNQRLKLIAERGFSDLTSQVSSAAPTTSATGTIEQLLFFDPCEKESDTKEEIVRMVTISSPKPVRVVGKVAKIVRRMLRGRKTEVVGQR